jgi:DNA helicase-2/ATP-dependent DNA helicase PcrA
MTVPKLDLEDLKSLHKSFPSLDFTDTQRQAVLLEHGSRDIQAAPGSGKTTILAAKLLLLAKKWAHPGRGILVLSHTNVARDEISKRLSTSSTGARLLGYPHSIGTIHAFVNQYLGIPFLRSTGKTIDIIDDAVFASRALATMRSVPSYSTLKSWVEKNPNNGPAAVATLRYEGPDLVVGWESGHLPDEGKPTREQAKALKRYMSANGVFRYDDMFAFAQRLLARCPNLRKRLSYRFPIVFIDEMQDTSHDQELLLSAIFDESVVIQRFGDRNQRILGTGTAIQQLTFPKSGHLNVSTTKRFPQSIASVVSSVQVHGEPVTPNNDTETCIPVIMLYKSENVGNVIELFGKEVLSKFSDKCLANGTVKAICARKQGEANKPPGRHLGDYWPAFLRTKKSESAFESIHKLLVDPVHIGRIPIELNQRARSVKRAILLALRDAECPEVAGIRDANFLFRTLEIAGFDVSPLRRLCHRLTTSRDQTHFLKWTETIDLMHAGLARILPSSITREKFGNLQAFGIFENADADALLPDRCVVTDNGRSVTIQIGTIASVKGETHLATLVLEAYGHQAKRHDLESVLESIATGASINPKAKESTQSFYRNIYVASSRPSKMLCLAMNRDRASDAQITALNNAGWKIVEV